MGREDGTDTVGSVGASASSGSASSGMSDNFGMHDDSFGQQEYGGPNNLGGSSEDHVRASFNAVNQITEKNPYGNDGFFTRTLGIDPSKIDYSDLMDLNTRSSIANNQFSKFANPTNTPGQLGYNRQFDPAPMGQLRSGVQKANYQTAYGPVMEQARKQSTGEMLARGAFGGLLGGLPGLALGQIGTKEYGLPGVAGFERFDPNNPNPGGGMLGQFLGGVNPTQAKDALVGAFAPVVPAPEPTSIGTAPADLKGFENRFSQHPLTGEKTAPALGSVFEVDGRSFIAGKNGPIELKGAAEQQVVSPSPLMNSFAPETELRTPTEQYARETGQLAYPSSTSTDGYNYTMDAPSYLTDTSDRKAQAQNVGLFGEDPRTAGFRDLEGMIKSVVDGENFPDDQNMYGPGMPDQTPLSPDELNNLLEPLGMKLGRGPSTANQLAQVDFSNLNNVGGNLYQPVPETSAFDSFLEKFGMSEPKRRSSGQIYSPNKSRSFFDNPVGYVLGS